VFLDICFIHGYPVRDVISHSMIHEVLELPCQVDGALFSNFGENGYAKVGICSYGTSITAHRPGKELIYIRQAVLSGAQDSVDLNSGISTLKIKTPYLTSVQSYDLESCSLTLGVFVGLKVDVLDVGFGKS
jgi:hypothetical protein